MEKFVITEVCNAIYIEDCKGKKLNFKDRRYSGFIITVEGKIQFSYDKGAVVADENTAVFLPKGFDYTNRCIENARSYVFNFHTAEKYEKPIALSCVRERMAKDAYEKISDLHLTPCPEGEMLIFKELYDLAAKLFAEARPKNNGERLLEEAVKFMNESYSDASLKISDVSQHCFISEIYLRKLFLAKYGTTPFKHLTSVRMNKARLLCAEKIPVGDVARRVGYSDVYQFSRAYKRFFGFSPTDN